MVTSPLVPSLLLDTLVLLSLASLGGLLALAVLSHLNLLQLLSLAYPLGAGAFTWAVFLVSALGFQASIARLLIFYCLVMMLLGLVILTQRKVFHIKFGLGGARVGTKVQYWILWLLIGTIFLFAAFLAVTRSYSSWDAAAGWAIKGYGIAQEGSIYAARRWGAWGLSYPLNIPIQISFFRSITNDVLPGSKLIFPIYFVSAILACVDFWIRRGVSVCVSLVAAIFLALTPFLFLHATIGYANLPLACYLILSAIWALEGVFGVRTRKLVMSGILLALSSWTRPEALLYCLGIVIAVILAHLITKRGRIAWIPWLLPFLIGAGSWFVVGGRSAQQSHLGQAVYGVLPSILDGEFRLFELYLIPRLFVERALDVERWGVLFPLIAIVALIGIWRLRPRRDPEIFSLLLISVFLGLIPMLLFYVRAFTRSSDFVQLLNRSFDRAFLPASIALFVFAISLHTLGTEIKEKP